MSPTALNAPIGAPLAAETPSLAVERISELSEDDLHALCEAADTAIIDGGGFGWVTPPGRRALESYFTGLLLVPERELFVGRLGGVIVGSAQLVRPPRNNEAQAFAATLAHAFVAPYARGHGLARLMTTRVEDRARAQGIHVLNLDVRETQDAAIHLYESLSYVRWALIRPMRASPAARSVAISTQNCCAIQPGRRPPSRTRHDRAHPLSRHRSEGWRLRPPAPGGHGGCDDLFR